jgi:hypothetical protein
MEKFNGYLFAKLFRIGSKMEGPEYFLQQWDRQRKTTDTHIHKKAHPWEIDSVLHRYLAMKVTISGTLKKEEIWYENVTIKGEKGIKKFEGLPRAEANRLIDFKKANVRSGIVPKKYILIVSGTKPYVNMEVSLKPLVYIKPPEYWGIEVIGSLNGIGLPALTPYTASIPLDSITGTEGIEVIGARHSEKKKVPPK